MTSPSAASFQLLEGGLADRVRALEVFANLRVQGFLQGANASTLKGFTADFLQHRQYHPGDNLKYLDWRVYAKSGRLCVREYEELTNSQLTVVLDVSGSMEAGGTGRFTKHDFAVRNAAVLLTLACQQQDQFSLAFFRDGRVSHLPFRSGRGHLARALAALLEPEASGGTDFLRGLAESTAHVRRRGLVAVLSDFMDDPDVICRQLASLRHRQRDVIALQVYDPREADLDFNAVTRFHDPETGEVLVVDPVLVRREYRRCFEAHIEALREGCRRHGFDHAALPVGDAYELPLAAYLRSRLHARR